MSEPKLLGSRFMQPRDQRNVAQARRTGIAADIYSIAFFESMIAIEKHNSQNEPLRHIR